MNKKFVYINGRGWLAATNEGKWSTSMDWAHAHPFDYNFEMFQTLSSLREQGMIPNGFVIMIAQPGV